MPRLPAPERSDGGQVDPASGVRLRAENYELAAYLYKEIMKQFNRKTGAVGEDMAAGYLFKEGFAILERNFSNKFGEIDIIARDRDTIVFVEVKTKVGEAFGSPEEMVGRGKLQRIRNMATIYLNGKSAPCRIDVVAIVLDENNNVVRFTHHENVY